MFFYFYLYLLIDFFYSTASISKPPTRDAICLKKILITLYFLKLLPRYFLGFFSSSFGHFHFGSLSLSISGQVDAIYKKINKFLITCYSDFLLWIRYFLFFLPSFRHLFVASGFDSLRYWLVLLPVT